MSLKLNAPGGGSVTLQEPTTADNLTLNLPAASGTVVYENASGNVGIGTSSPTGRLHVRWDAGVGDGYTGKFKFQTTDQVINLRSYWESGVGQHGTVASENGSGLPTALRLSGDSIQILSGSSATERARIDSSGNFLVGTTSQFTDGGFVSVNFGAAGNGIGLQCSTSGDRSPITFRNSNGLVGRVSTNGTSTAYLTSSDYRLKDNIAPMTGALAKVAALKPVTYKWKADGSDGEGFIAHELQAVVPQCVAGEKDAVDSEGNPVYQGIDTSFLVATLTAAIQELKAEVDSLRAQVESK